MDYPAPAPVEPRLIAAAAAAIVSGLLLLLYLNRRRTYVLFWIFGWMLIAASMVILGTESRRGGELAQFVEGDMFAADISRATVLALFEEQSERTMLVMTMIMTLFAATIIVFTVSRLAGDPKLIYALPEGYGMTQERLDALDRKLGLGGGGDSRLTRSVGLRQFELQASAAARHMSTQTAPISWRMPRTVGQPRQRAISPSTFPRSSRVGPPA